jgi:predicted ArsR family transcriptional regulator
MAGLKSLSGESMPEKLLFQYFQKLQAKWQPILAKLPTIEEKFEKLATLRAKEGSLIRCRKPNEMGLALEEIHNPLQRIFEQYPTAVSMELRMIEALLGVRLSRSEISGGRGSQPRVMFELTASPSTH